MTVDEFYDEVHRLLGVSGPAGERRLSDGTYLEVYCLPDGSKKELPAPQKLTPLQRQEIIDELKRHLSQIKKNRTKRAH